MSYVYGKDVAYRMRWTGSSCVASLGVRSMSREVTRDEALAGIQKALADVEDAIRHHPERTRSLYDGGKAAFLKRLEGAEQADWRLAHDLTPAQFAIMHHYLVAASFMSAWFHMRWDKRRRDRAAQSACVLVSALGLDPLEVMQGFIMYEQAWRVCMRSAGIGFGRTLGWLVVIFCVIGFALWLACR